MEQQPTRSHLEFKIDDMFRPYLAAAIARLGYLHPNIDIAMGKTIVVTGIGDENRDIVARDFKYALYRERIHAESAETRAALMGALLR